MDLLRIQMLSENTDEFFGYSSRLMWEQALVPCLAKYYLDIVEMVSCLSRVGIQSLKGTCKGTGHLQIIPALNVLYRLWGLKDFITPMENLRKLYAVMICKASCNIKSTNFLSNSVDSNLSSTPYWLTSQGRVILTFRTHFFIKTWNVFLQIFLSITGDPSQVWPPQHREIPLHLCPSNQLLLEAVLTGRQGRTRAAPSPPARAHPEGKAGLPRQPGVAPHSPGPATLNGGHAPQLWPGTVELRGLVRVTPGGLLLRWLSGPPFSHLQGEPRHYRRGHLLLAAVGQTRVGKSDQERTRASA